MKTGRISNARRLRDLPGVVTPRTIAMSREVLAGPDGVAALAEQQLAFPLLLRSPGYHTGRNFILVETAAELSAAAESLRATISWRSNISTPAARTATRANTA